VSTGTTVSREVDQEPGRSSSSTAAPMRPGTTQARATSRRRHLIPASIGMVGVIVVLALLAALATLASPGSVLGGDTVNLAAGAIFAGAYLALAIGKIPGLSIDRAGVALVGGGVLTLVDAYKGVVFDTITLLLGIMIVVANLRLSGFFALANAWVVRRTQRPIILLAAVTVVSGMFSAFLVNDAICLVLSPLVLELTLSLRRRPTQLPIGGRAQLQG
jgi:hypothetical protein